MNAAPARPSSPIADTLAGQHLVVTGATGFLGGVWLSLVLTHAPDVGRITLLVRGRPGLDARARVAAMIDTSPAFRPLRDAHGAHLAAFLDARLDVLDADVSRPRLGLDDATWHDLARRADAVVHIAGLTDFHPDPAKAVPANVDGALEVATLAEALPTPRMLHVSTAYVAGRRDGEIAEALVPGLAPSGVRFDPVATHAALHDLLRCHPTPKARTEAAADLAERLGWPNIYTLTKGVAEHVLATRPLDLTVVRPSVVECARTFPFPGWNDGLNTSGPILWYCGTAFRALPSTAEHTFDIIPVDAVARWTTAALAALLEGRHAPVYHLASGDVNPASFARIVELTALARRRHGRDGTGDDDLFSRLSAHIDVVPRRREALPTVHPDRVERWVDGLHRGLGTLSDRLPSAATGPLSTARRRLARTRRDMGRLRRMLDLYRPFIHDHHWTFRTDHIRAEADRLASSDPFHDDVTGLCWRRYWIDVQYPGIARWAFPILRGERVPTDPPSRPPLVLGSTEHPLARGVA